MIFAPWKFSILLLFSGCLFCGGPPAHADSDPFAQLQQAENAYKDNKPADALAIYEKLLADSNASQWNLAALNFNAGNSALRANKLGWAYAYFSHAAMEDPLDSDISTNLQILEQQLSKAPKRATAPLGETLSKNIFSHTPTAIWISILLTCTCGVLAIFFRLRSVPAGAITLLVLAFLSSIIFGVAEYAQSIKNGVVIADEIVVRSGPGETFPEIVTIGQGSTVQIKESSTGWFKIAFELPQSGGKHVVGWAGMPSVHRLKP